MNTIRLINNRFPEMMLSSYSWSHRQESKAKLIYAMLCHEVNLKPEMIRVNRVARFLQPAPCGETRGEERGTCHVYVS